MALEPAEARALRRAAAGLEITLSDEQVERIGRHVDLLDLWNQRLRLTGERDRATLLTKHAVDSMAPLRFLPPAGLVVDIGSGGGFPGLVLGVLRSDLSLLLVESRRRPSSFLAEAIRDLGLANAQVRTARAEELAVDGDVAAQAACVVSRAVRLDAFLPLAKPLLAPDGVVVAFQAGEKGADDVVGVADANAMEVAERWNYRLSAGERRSLVVFRSK